MNSYAVTFRSVPPFATLRALANDVLEARAVAERAFLGLVKNPTIWRYRAGPSWSARSSCRTTDCDRQG